MTKTDDASPWFADGFNCSQSVLTASGGDYGLTEEQCLKLGCSFGGGIARKQLTCGAVAGDMEKIRQFGLFQKNRPRYVADADELTEAILTRKTTD